MYFQDLRHDFRGATEQGLNACSQLSEGKRLHQIIVRTRKKKVNFLLCFVSCGKDQDGNGDAALSSRTANLMAVHAGQHEVEDDKVVIFPVKGDARKGLFAVIDG